MKPILIAGPTASGKSGLAVELAKRNGGVVINADALQVYDQWRILSARPSIEDERTVPHALYGHVAMDRHYSVGGWLTDLRKVLQDTDLKPIIVGGTGLYFGALLNGLADIPAIPPQLRAQGNEIALSDPKVFFTKYLQQNDPETFDNMDQQNPARLQRAWEVHMATGQGLAYWKSTTPPPLLRLEETLPINLNWQVNSLNDRIDVRFDQMIEMGAVEEVERVKNGYWHPALPSSRALGAAEIIDAIDGKITLEDAVNKAKLLTRQFAKRQRTWFRGKMANWQQVAMNDSTSLDEIIANLIT